MHHIAYIFSPCEHHLHDEYLSNFTTNLISIHKISRNTKKAESNVNSLEKEIEENSANIEKLEVSYSFLNYGLGDFCTFKSLKGNV